MGKRDTEAEFAENVRDLIDQDYDRIAFWAANKYYSGGVIVPEELDAEGNVVTPASVRPPTGAEVFHALTDNVYSDIKRECEAWYLQQAEAQARASVAPIVLNPPE
jgi:hypothetical protein